MTKIEHDYETTRLRRMLPRGFPLRALAVGSFITLALLPAGSVFALSRDSSIRIEMVGLMVLLWMFATVVWGTGLVTVLFYKTGSPYLVWLCVNLVVSVSASLFLIWAIGQIAAAC